MLSASTKPLNDLVATMAASTAVADTTRAEEAVVDMVVDTVVAVSDPFCLASTSEGIAVIFILLVFLSS